MTNKFRWLIAQLKDMNERNNCIIMKAGCMIIVGINLICLKSEKGSQHEKVKGEDRLLCQTKYYSISPNSLAQLY